jgi:type IV pilus assembly protein PilA
MLNRLRQRSQEEGGFTLIELLVVILIIGILAAIAIPSFLNQKSKAQDSAAKQQVTTLQTAIETYATDHNGSYVNASLAELQKIEPTLKDESTAKPAVVKAEAEGYEVESTSVGSEDKFKLKNEAGQITRTCTTKSGGTGSGGCPTGKW